MAAEAIAVRLAEITARSAGGIAADAAADVARVGAKAVVGWFMMTFLMCGEGDAMPLQVVRHRAGRVTA